ncbi:hypothetical protein HMPREF0653_00668 [Prevotella disiens JCM 6334 = ATCC 29426]|uniref:Uncharacterized protein n=1 Tax=Prevotella disiens JCM 6334 = ATCC 29426 TaxID=1235811 RepID=A0ABN0NTZ4_9BACT|nr:hypothetical protein HMPREF0653_00668 [Prevotella disiens JCM 6334 = ATCC 29426]
MGIFCILERIETVLKSETAYFERQKSLFCTSKVPILQSKQS